MITHLSEFFTEKLISDGNIAKEDRELYVYGFFMLLSQLMYLIIVCILGLIFGCFFESVIFYAAFLFIRRYAGGYHASSEARCELMSISSIVASIAVIKLSGIYNFGIFLLILAGISAVCIFILCPLDTPEKPLSDKEIVHFRKTARIILAIIAVAAVVSYVFRLKVLFAPDCVSLILESVLLAAGKIKERRLRFVNRTE